MVERGRASLAFARLRNGMAGPMRPLEREQLAAVRELEPLYLDDVRSGRISSPAPPGADSPP